MKEVITLSCSHGILSVFPQIRSLCLFVLWEKRRAVGTGNIGQVFEAEMILEQDVCNVEVTGKLRCSERLCRVAGY